MIRDLRYGPQVSHEHWYKNPAGVTIGKAPGKADHYDNGGQSLQRMGRNDEAEAEFKKARELRGQ